MFSSNRILGVDKIENILRKYPDINPEWLLTGKGSMLRSGEPPIAQAVAINLGASIPLIPLDAIAELGTDYMQQIIAGQVEEHYVIPDFERLHPDYMIRVKGNSMTPKYNSGDIIACKIIHIDDFIQWNMPHVLDTATKGYWSSASTKAAINFTGLSFLTIRIIRHLTCPSPPFATYPLWWASFGRSKGIK